MLNVYVENTHTILETSSERRIFVCIPPRRRSVIVTLRASASRGGKQKPLPEMAVAHTLVLVGERLHQRALA